MTDTSTLWASGTPATTQTAGTWAGATNATGANNATYAGWTTTTANSSATITPAGYGAQAAIGSQPTSVDQVAVTVYVHVTNITRLPTISVQLTDAGTPFGTPQTITASSTTTYSETKVFTGVTWAQLANLGVRVSFTRNNATQTVTGNVDAIGTVVSYTPAAVNATLTTTTGSAPSGGGQGALTGTTDVTLTTTTGVSVSAGGQGALTGTTGNVDATLTTTTGTATAAGGSGQFIAASDATFATLTGTATAAGEVGSMVLGISATGGTASGTGWVDPTNATGAPNDTYATWTTEVDAATSDPLIISNFGTWADIPAGATIESVEIRVQHHESTTGSPIQTVTAQAYLGATPLGTPTNLTLSLTDRDDVLTPTLSLAELQGNTLAVRIIGDRV